VLHGCDNKLCVNVEHLRLGTHAENTADAMTRGQNPLSRVAPPWTKIPEERLPEVFALRAQGLTQQRIADQLGVSRPLISMLLSGKLKRMSRVTQVKGDSN
jgi:DNA-binding CsgD family transcriptional regulator